MRQIPKTENALVLRTDFSDQLVWEAVRKEIQKPVGFFIYQFGANVQYLDDKAFADLDKGQIMSLLPKNYDHSFLIVADQLTISNPEHPLLIIDLFAEPGRDFRAVPSQIQAIENNLSIANMDFEEFAGAA